jgi:hypothetical protein
MLEIDDLVFKEWWTKYPGFNDCCGKCPGCCAIEYDDYSESPKDLLSGSFGCFIFNIFSNIYNDVAMPLGQW